MDIFLFISFGIATTLFTAFSRKAYENHHPSNGDFLMVAAGTMFICMILMLVQIVMVAR